MRARSDKTTGEPCCCADLPVIYQPVAAVLHLRETATKMGLMRKHRGILQLTAADRKLRTDPVSLWWHLAERMPPRSADRCET
jgi:hypothetical protein